MLFNKFSLIDSRLSVFMKSTMSKLGFPTPPCCFLFFMFFMSNDIFLMRLIFVIPSFDQMTPVFVSQCLNHSDSIIIFSFQEFPNRSTKKLCTDSFPKIIILSDALRSHISSHKIISPLYDFFTKGQLITSYTLILSSSFLNFFIKLYSSCFVLIIKTESFTFTSYT